MNGTDFVAITPAVMVLAIIELFKWLWRKFVVKDMNFDFPPKFYEIINPVLQVAVLPLMALLLPEQYQLPTDWVLFGRMVLLVALNSILTSLFYNQYIAKAKEYRRMYTAKYK
jgi:hypothetical protein